MHEFVYLCVDKSLELDKFTLSLGTSFEETINISCKVFTLSAAFYKPHYNINLLPLASLVPRVAKYCDLQKVDDQWRKLPLVQLPEDITQCTEPDMFWGKLLKYKNLFNETEFIELARFALDTLCLPHANADCESI